MSTLKTILISLLLAFPLLSDPVRAEAPVSAAPSTINLKARVQGYVDAMMNGSKAAILKHKDYYSTIFVATSGKVVDVVAEEDGLYRATLSFQTTERYLQDMESQPHSVKKGQGMGEIRKTVTFTVSPDSVHWQKRLDSPFVKPGKQSRYLMGPVRGASSHVDD